MIACIYVPHFAAMVEQQFNPVLRDCPFVLKASPRKLYGISQCAAKFGVTTAMSPSHAKAHCPDIQFVQAAPSRYERALDNLLERLSRFSSHIDILDVLVRKQKPGFLHSVFFYVDLGKLQYQQKVEIAQAMGRMLKHETPYRASIGIGNGKYVARVASIDCPTETIRHIAPDTEQEYLSNHSVSTLPAKKETLRRLELLGLRTVGQVASISASAMFDQFGHEGKFLRLLALGQDSTPVLPYKPKQYIHQYRQFDSPVSSRFVMQSHFSAITGEVSELLKNDNLGGQKLILTLHQDDKRILDKTVVLRTPTSDVRRIYSTLLEMLSTLDVQSGIVELSVEITDIADTKPQQLELFPSETNKALQFEQAVESLILRYGVGRFYEPRVVNETTPLPERRFELHEVESA